MVPLKIRQIFFHTASRFEAASRLFLRSVEVEGRSMFEIALLKRAVLRLVNRVTISITVVQYVWKPIFDDCKPFIDHVPHRK